MVLKFEPWGEEPVFDWDQHNEEKFWHHAIRDFEIMECFTNEHFTKPHPKANAEPEKYGDRFLIRGVTDGGRKLIIIVQYKGGNVVRPITGWEE